MSSPCAPGDSKRGNLTGYHSTLDPNLLNVPVENPVPPVAEPPPANDPGDVFELVGGDETCATHERRHLPSPSGRGRPIRAEKSNSDEPRPEPRVDEVWSRGKEWSRRS